MRARESYGSNYVYSGSKITSPAVTRSGNKRSHNLSHQQSHRNLPKQHSPLKATSNSNGKTFYARKPSQIYKDEIVAIQDQD